MLALAGSASAAVTQKQAAKKALAALGSTKRTDPVIVFGLPRPIRAGTEVAQAGTDNPVTGSTRGLTAKLREAGVRTVKAPSVLRAATRSYFFYEDRAPFQMYQHPGKVALVDAETGRVRVSKVINWPPLLNGRLPAFLKNAAAYRSAKYQVLYRAWEIDGGAQQPRVANRNLFDLDPFGPGRPLPDMGNAKTIADRLAAERSCVLRVTDTLPTFWNVNQLNMTRSYIGTLFDALERENGGFVDDRYGARSGESLAESVDRLVADGCKDVLLYIAGQGYDEDGDPVIQLGTAIRPGGLIAQQNVSGSDLRELVSERPGVTFKFKFDAPYSGAFAARLSDLANVLLIEAPSAPGDPAFAYIPEVEQNGQMLTAGTNPAGLLEFTNCELNGFKAFFESAAEIDRATQAQNEGVSFLVEMLARSQELCRGIGFADDLGFAPVLFAAERGSGKGTNLPPNADPQTVAVTEDTPKSITLNATDPDGNPLTFAITKQPEHGTLSGSGATRTYTPDANYVGGDDFSFKATDDKGAESNTAKVTINVGPGNDAPVVTNSSGATSFSEQGAEVDVDPALTVSDIDDTHLENATVRIASGFQSGDTLDVPAQLGITGTYNTGTGVLTLTGHATLSDWQTVLRDVGYDGNQDNPSGPKTIEFKVGDGDADSAASTKNVSVTPVNDNPVLDTTDTALAYGENQGEQPADNGVTVTDVDSANLTGATVQITSNFSSAQDDLTFNNSNALGVTGTYNDSTGTLTLSGSASVANYQAALRLVKYVNSSESPSTATRTVSFRADDGAASNNLSNVGTRDINVSAADDAPVAGDDSRTVTEDSAASDANNEFAVLSNDTDVDGGPMEIQSVSNPDHGTATIVQGAPDTIEYAPDPNYCNSNASPAAPDTFEYELNGGDKGTVSVTVTCVDDAPVANDDSPTVTEDTQTDLSVLSNDTDADGDQIEITNVTDPANGTTSVVDGSPDKVRYTPDANYCNNPPGSTPDSFTYTVNGGDTATVSVSVSCVNDAPVANNDTATVGEDSGATQFSVLSNDTDVESDTIEITNVTTPSTPGGGTVTVVDGSPDKVEYTPGANYCNNPPGSTPDTFTYTVNGGDTATVSVTVNCSNDPPVANNDTATVSEDSGANDINVVANDIDVEGDAIDITQITDQPDNGTATIKPGTPEQITYTPNANYCNSNASPAAPDTITYEVNGGDTATVSVTVSCVDDAHVANDDSATVNEDSGTTEINVTANDTDVENDAIQITSVTQPASGTGTAAVVDGTPDKVSYTPPANYCNNPPGTTLATFTYTVAGGDTATVTVTVDCDDDNPVGVNDSATVAEDSANNEIDVLANDTDVDGGTKTVQSKTNGTNGTVVITNAGAKVEYTPNANFCGSDSFTYTLNGGSSATVNVTVTCTNDAPVVDLNGAGAGINTTVSFNEVVAGTGNPTTVAPSLETSDVDDTHLEGATVVLTNEQNVDEESLSIDTALAATKGIGVSIAANLDSITLTSNAPNTVTKADYQAVLRTVKYDNDALVLDTTPDRVIEFKVNDGTADSAIATATVQIVPINVPPTLDLNGGGAGENEAVTFTEGGGAVQLAPNATTTDSDDTHYSQATITLTNQQNGALEVLNVSNAGAVCVQVTNNNSHAITLSGNCTIADYQTVIRTATYNHTSDLPTASPSRSVEFKVNDGVDNSPTRTSTVTVAPTNDAPVNTVPGGQTLNEDGSKTFSSAAPSNQISVNDVDAGTNPIKVTLSVTNGTLTLNGTTGLTFTAPADGTSDQTMTFTGSQSDINAALNGLIYTPNSNYNGADTLTITTDDQGQTGGAAQQDTDNVGLTITAVNDGPTNTVPGAQQVDEDQPLTFSSGNGNAVSIADPDSGASDVRVSLGVGLNGRLNLATTAGLNFACAGCSGDGVNDATTVFEGTVAEVNAALNGMTYQGVLNFNGSDSLSITTSDLGNTGTGGAKTDPAAGDPADAVAITVNPVNDAPTADAEIIGDGQPGEALRDTNNQAHGNTTYQVDDPSDNKSPPTNPHSEITGDILDGDSDVDGPGPLIVQSAGADAGATNGQTADGGTVSTEQDGDFVYNPPAETSCDNGTDSFNYKISDQANSGGGPIPGTAIGTVTIHLEGCVWYVSNNAAGNAGTATQPFDTLAQAETKSGANHTVFVFDGDNTDLNYATGYAMNSGERLIGEHEGLTHDQDQGGSMTADTLHPANPGAHPTLSALNEDVVQLDDGNVVHGFNLEPGGTGGGIAGAAGDTGGATIDDVNILDTGVAGQQPGLELDGTTGTFNVSNLVVNNLASTSPPNTATGVRLNSAGTVNFDPASQISIGTKVAKGLEAIGPNTNLGTSTFDDITVSSASAGGVRLDTTTGTVALGDGTGSDLSLTTTSGSDAALRVNSHTGGTLTVDSAGADDLHATGGPALDVTGTSGPTLAFEDVDSTNSVNDGINLDGLGAGTFTATSGDLVGADGISFDLNGGSNTITYPGNFGNHDGTTAIDITGRSGTVAGGSTVLLSGPISDTNDSGGGLNLSSNTGGQTRLTNGTKQFNTGASDGVSFTSSDGHTLELSGGGLDIDVGTGNGLAATTSGTLEVSGSGNTLDKTGAGNRGLNISDTDIAAADVTFQRIRTDGALTGIRLNSTGGTGNLAVTGAGGTCTNADTSGCSGGEIENGSGANSGSNTPDGTGIVLHDTDNVSLTRMWIHDHSNYGIKGTDVIGFTLQNSTINGTNGDDAGNNDGSVVFDHLAGSGSALSGSASVSNTHIQGGAENNFGLSNDSGTLNRLTLDTVTVGPNSNTLGNASIDLEGLGTATLNATVQNTSMTSTRGHHFGFTANGSGGGDLDFYNNTITNNHGAQVSGAGAALFRGGAAGGTVSIDVSNGGLGDNTFQGAKGHAVVFEKAIGNGTFNATFDNADVGVAATANSGSSEGSGLKVEHEGGGTMNATVTNNEIRQYNNFGMQFEAGDGVDVGGTYNLNVTNNTVANPGTLAAGNFQGISLNNGATGPTETFDTCWNFRQNIFSNSGRGTGFDLRLRSRGDGDVRIAGATLANSTDDAGVAAYALANNTFVDHTVARGDTGTWSGGNPTTCP